MEYFHSLPQYTLFNSFGYSFRIAIKNSEFSGFYSAARVSNERDNVHGKGKYSRIRH